MASYCRAIGLVLIWNIVSACVPHSMITAFVVRCLDSIIPLLAIAEISRPKPVSVAKQAGLSLNWSQTPKAGFVVRWLIYEPPHDKTNKMTCAPSEDSDQPGHQPSLIRVFAVRSQGSQGPKLSSRGQRKLGRMLRLRWVFAGRTSFCHAQAHN